MRGQFVHAFAKLFNTFTDGRTHLRQLFGAKDKQSDDKNDDQIESVKSGDHGECPFLLYRDLYKFVRFLLIIRYYDKNLQVDAMPCDCPCVVRVILLVSLAICAAYVYAGLVVS